jgi:uncharacterized protein YuzE
MALQEVTHGTLRAEYDSDADALYVYFSNREYSHGRDLDPARRIDYAADGSVVGVELLSPSMGVDLTGLPSPDEIAILLDRLHLPVTLPAS